MQALHDVQAALVALVAEQTKGMDCTVSMHAPDTWEELQRAKTAGLVVYAGASDQTMYGVPYGNRQFRAWHDSVHLAWNADFTMGSDAQRRGEWQGAREQCRMAEKTGTRLAHWLWADLRAQEASWLAHGVFPDDQVTCVRDFVTTHGFDR